MKNTEEYIKSNENDYTHIKFYYSHGGTMTVNKPTYKHVFPREKNVCEKFEYLIEKDF